MADVVESAVAEILALADDLGRSQRATRLRGIAARLSQAGAGCVVVKPLEFRKPPEDDFLSRVETILGTARVWTHHEANGMWFWKLGDIASGTEANEAACKTMLWLTYQDRILSTLAASLSAGEPVAWRWRFADEKPNAPWSFKQTKPDNIGPELLVEPLYANPPAPVPTASVEAVAAFLKERDESLLAEEADDAERTASAQEILRLASLTPPPVMGRGAPVALDDLIKRSIEAVTDLDDWANVNETEFTGWGDGIVPPGAEFMRVKSGQALKALKEIETLRSKAHG